MTKASKHPQWNNPTVIEAIVEIHLHKKISGKDFDKIHKLLKEAYHIERESLTQYVASVQQQNFSIQKSDNKDFRIRTVLDSNIFSYLYRDKLSFHYLGNYLGWDSLKPCLKSVFEIITSVDKAIEYSQVGVRYINLIKEKKITQTIEHWLVHTSNYPKSLLKSKTDYFYRCKSFLKSNIWSQITIAEGKPLDKDVKPLLFDIDVIEKNTSPKQLDLNAFEQATSLHDLVYIIFESSISKNYINLLNKKRK
ncbi:MAG: TIGR04255 family protein [Chlamydiia bacterium]|nr:TIGR04255 family protein [Chlamydiia bacterium]